MFSVIFYSYTLFTSGLDDQNTCVTLDDWFLQVKVLILVDIVQTMIVPFIIISITNSLIMVKLMNSFSFKMRDNSSFMDSNTSKKNFRSYDVTDTDSLSSNLNEQNRQILIRQSYQTHNSRHNKPSTNKETTKTLVIIASTFLLLNFPIASTKTFYFFKSGTETDFLNSDFLYQLNNINNNNNNKNVSINHIDMNHLLNLNYSSISLANITHLIDLSNEKFGGVNESFMNKTTYIEVFNDQVVFNQKKELLERIASLIYYINFSINFFLYTFNTKQFRDIFIHIFKHSK